MNSIEKNPELLIILINQWNYTSLLLLEEILLIDDVWFACGDGESLVIPLTCTVFVTTPVGDDVPLDCLLVFVAKGELDPLASLNFSANYKYLYKLLSIKNIKQ